VDDVFEQPVLCFGGDNFTQAAVRAVDEDAAEAADLRGDGYGSLRFVRVILYHLQKYFIWDKPPKGGAGRVGVAPPLLKLRRVR